MSTHVRLSHKPHAILKLLAQQEGTSIQAVLEEAIELYRRKKFLQKVNAGYERVKRDPQKWKELVQERVELDATLLDGLGNEEQSYDSADTVQVPKDRDMKGSGIDENNVPLEQPERSRFDI